MSDDLQVADKLQPVAPVPRALTPAAFHQLADVPPALTWFANIDNRNRFLSGVVSFDSSSRHTPFRVQQHGAWHGQAGISHLKGSSLA